MNIRIPAGALVLIADETKARLLRNKGNALHVDFVIEAELEQNMGSPSSSSLPRTSSFTGRPVTTLPFA